MIVVDTSAWIEFLRATRSNADRAVTAAIRREDELGIVDVVRLELLAGTADDVAADDLRRLLGRFTHLASESPADSEYAAVLYRTARHSGKTVRSLLDCLVAAVAVRLDAPVLARDRDFDVLAAVSPLRVL